MDFHYLLDAKTEGRVIVLRFLQAEKGEIVERRDSDYKPYFFLSHPLSNENEEEIRRFSGEIEVVKKRDLFTDKSREVTKVTVHSSDILRKASRMFKKAWETELEYTQSYVYDRKLIFGAPYTILENQFNLVNQIPEELQNKFESTFTDIKTTDPQKYSQIRDWFLLLQQPIPQVDSEHLGLKEAGSEHLYQVFMLARIANIPVTLAHRSRSVSDWLRSMIHGYLRKNNVLIPMSRELRRGLKTHRVPGALTLTPKTGVYFNTVVCDFESLYPSLIDSYNLSYETVNCPHQKCKKNKIKECSQHWVCTKRRGFYSILVGALKELRIRWFKPLSKNMVVSKREREAAESLSKLLKLISVSSYGVTVRIHGLACPPLAECITGYGRWALQSTWNMAKANNLHPTYGDTDSIFLDNPQPTKVEWLTKTVKEELKLDLAIEKKYSLCVLPAAKKAYFGILPDGNPDIKGLTVIKSNSPNLIRQVFQNCVKELSHVKTLEEYQLAKKRIVTVIQQAVNELRKRRVKLQDLVYSVKLYYDPEDRLSSGMKLTPQPYQCALQLLNTDKKIHKGDTVQFVKVKPFNYNGKTFTVKPVELVKSVKEINVEDYIRNMTTALNQTFTPMGIKLVQKPENRIETRISDWFEN